MNILKSDNVVELFNLAFIGVLAQGEPSSIGKTCVYQLPDKKHVKCGIGHCLTDDSLAQIYSADIGERAEQTRPVSYTAGVKTLMDTLNSEYGFIEFDQAKRDELDELLPALQRAHDDAEEDFRESETGSFVFHFRNRMREIAEKLLNRTDMDDNLGLPTS